MLIRNFLEYFELKVLIQSYLILLMKKKKKKRKEKKKKKKAWQ